jgi:hypothetical protein
MSYIINEHMDDVINEDPDAITLVRPLTHIILTWLSYIKVHSQKTPTQCETIAVNEIWKAAVTLSKYKPSQKQKIGLNFSAEDEHYNVYEEDEDDEEDEEEEEQDTKDDVKDEDYDPDNEEDRFQVLQDMEDDKNFYDFVVEENKDW